MGDFDLGYEEGQEFDSKDRPVNFKGYLTDSEGTGAIINKYNYGLMFHNYELTP